MTAQSPAERVAAFDAIPMRPTPTTVRLDRLMTAYEVVVGDETAVELRVGDLPVLRLVCADHEFGEDVAYALIAAMRDQELRAIEGRRYRARGVVSGGAA